MRTFLLETSVLERLSGACAMRSPAAPGSQSLLEQMEAAGLFVVPLDEVRGWWRYHHLFADLLRARLQQEQPSRAAQLHRQRRQPGTRSMGWPTTPSARGGAGQMTWAARLIEQHFDALI